jgi:ribonuclease Y
MLMWLTLQGPGSGGLQLAGLILAVLVAILVGVVLGYLVKSYMVRSQIESAEIEVSKMTSEAETKAKELILAARSEALKTRSEAEEEMKKGRLDLHKQEERLQNQRESLDRRAENIENRERKLDQQQSKLDQQQSKLDKQRNEMDTLQQKRMAELQRVANLTREEAKQLLLQAVEEEARQDSARIIREVEDAAREEGERKAREIITLAIQRCAADQVAETTVSSVPLPSDDMKGRIIGRGGRNIRAIETITGVDLVIDDTPEAVILSSFDPVRREIARVALTKLVVDGRIHPARIEAVVDKAREDVNAIIREEGERVALEAGVPALHPELIRLLGRLKYRTSYGQSVLIHSLETSILAGIMAEELGANVALAREGGLLHDIGKAVDHEVDGPHAAIGADIAKRLGKSAKIVNCIGAHHSEEQAESLEAVLISAADAVSGARPGARRESLESYVKRLKALEEVANSFEGVGRSFAIQAGREVRIIVKPEEVDDLAAIRLSKDIAKRVEESLEYPGQIKVTVIRETRAVDYAK